ncbi:hypothetical protein GCM10008014_15610 [Paenibacillus silvae]|uniref:Uncharacterized protein n=1 Tax=Paenibacillus silvae TaxID=1325358 RepID=A0ABQ1Z791_9BACL|nr:hypothetical protein GCM10008014_15610 [Paenibacillus silvae]
MLLKGSIYYETGNKMEIQQRASHDIQPLIEQRADPFICRHLDGYYYFVASVPEYDPIEIRRAQNLEKLVTSTPVVIWRKARYWYP